MKGYLEKPLASCVCSLGSKILALGTSHMCKNNHAKRKV
jgi:hypothetical protein